jgi:hypothetical protein
MLFTLTATYCKRNRGTVIQQGALKCALEGRKWYKCPNNPKAAWKVRRNIFCHKEIEPAQVRL